MTKAAYDKIAEGLMEILASFEANLIKTVKEECAKERAITEAMAAPSENRVLTLKEVAAYTKISIYYLRTIIRRGDGPEVIQLSARRQGIRKASLDKWLNDNVVKIDARTRKVAIKYRQLGK